MRDAKAMGFVERLTGLDRDSNVFAHKSVLVEKVGQRVPQINGAMWPVVIRFACVHSLQRKLLLALSLRDRVRDLRYSHRFPGALYSAVH